MVDGVSGGICLEVRQNSCVDPSTVSRTLSLFNASGNVEERKYPPNTGTAVLTEIDKIIILETVVEKPETYLREIQQTLIQETGTDIDTSTFWRFLQTSNITRQKMVLVAKQRSELQRTEYLRSMTCKSSMATLKCWYLWMRLVQTEEIV